MRDLLIALVVCLVMVLAGGFFLYRTLRDVIEHIKDYKVQKAEKTIRWWYMEWIFIAADALLGSLTRPSVIISLFFFLVGTIGVLVNTFSIIASLKG